MPAAVNNFSLAGGHTHTEFMNWLKSVMSNTGLILIDEISIDATETQFVYEYTSPNYPSNFLKVGVDGTNLEIAIYDNWDANVHTGALAETHSHLGISHASNFYATTYNAGENARIATIQEGNSATEIMTLGFVGFDFKATNKSSYPKGVLFDRDSFFYLPNDSPCQNKQLSSLVTTNKFANSNPFDGGIDVIIAPPLLATQENCIAGFLNDDIAIGAFGTTQRNTIVTHPSGRYQVLYTNKACGYAIRIV